MKVTALERKRQEAFLALYEPVHDQFARYCMAIAGEEQGAKDLINETLLKSFEGFDNIRKKDSFLYYLFTSAKHIWSNQNRRNKFWKDVEHFEQHNFGKYVQSDAENRVDVNLLYAAMNELPIEQKEAVVLYEVSGCSLKEIQQIQNVGLSTVKSRLVRGRKKLASLLSDVESVKNTSDEGR
jgi:RNA polymerase sigma-70 factor (ECF subfamily)